MQVEWKQKLLGGLRALREKGFFHIIAGSTLAKIASFVSVIFLPRFLASKADYGLLAYVDNIRNYIMLANGLGIANATLRFCAQSDSDASKKGYFLASLYIGVGADVVIILGSIAVFWAVPFQYDGSNRLLLLSSVLPLFYFLFNDIQLLLRATFQNQKYSVFSFAYSFLLMVFQIGFAVVWGVDGVIWGRYVALGLCLVMGLWLIRDLPLMKVKAELPDRHMMWGLIKFGIVMLTASAASLVMNYNETTIVSWLIRDAELLAEYKVAANILPISLFVLEAVLVFILPYFIQHLNDKRWIWENYKKLMLINGAVMTVIHLGLFVLADFYVPILWGKQYASAAPMVRMFLIASLIQSVFRGLAGNILAVTGEENFNLKINIVCVVIHAVVDVVAIKTFGIMGAAVALIVVYFISGLIMNLHLRNICKNAIAEESNHHDEE